MRRMKIEILVRAAAGLSIFFFLCNVHIVLAAPSPRALSVTAEEVNNVYAKAQTKKCKEAKLIRKITADLKKNMDVLRDREEYFYRAEPIYSRDVVEFNSRLNTFISNLNVDADGNGHPDDGTLFSVALALRESIQTIETLAMQHPQGFALPDDISTIGPSEQAMLDALKELKRIMPAFRSSIRNCRAFEPDPIYFPGIGPVNLNRMYAQDYQERLFVPIDVIITSLNNVLPEPETPVSRSLHSDLYRMWQMTRHFTDQVEHLAIQGVIAVHFSTYLLEDMQRIKADLDDERHDLPKKGEDLAKVAEQLAPTIDNYCWIKPAALYSCSSGECRLDNKNKEFNLNALIENKKPR